MCGYLIEDIVDFVKIDTFRFKLKHNLYLLVFNFQIKHV